MTSNHYKCDPIEIVTPKGKWLGTFRYEKYLDKWFFITPDDVQKVAVVNTIDLPHELKDFLEKDNISWNQESYYVPLKVQIQLNAHCNYHCPICYASSLKGKSLKNDFTLEQLDDLFSQLKEWGVLRLNFVGGEIFMRKDIHEIIGMALDKRLLVSCITNARIPGKKIELFKPLLNRLFNVQVSCNGYGESYEGEYQTDSWDKAKESITNVIVNTKANILSYVITEKNVNDIPDFIDFANSINPTIIKFGTVCWSGRSINEKAIYYYKSVLPQAKEKISEMREKYPHLQIQSQIDQGAETPLWEEYINGYRPFEFYYAPEGRDGLYIKSNGDIFPFPLLSDREDLNLGNVHSDNIKHIWYNSPVLKKIRSVSFANSDCGKIGCNKVCGLWGRSYAIAWSDKFDGKVPCSLTNWV